jgi:hypothetical protein
VGYVSNFHVTAQRKQSPIGQNFAQLVTLLTITTHVTAEV